MPDRDLGISSRSSSAVGSRTTPTQALRSRFRWIVALLGLTLISLAVLDYRAFATLEQSTEWVNASFRRQSGVSAILEALVDAETRQRGYLLTSDPRYLEPYRLARATLPDRIAKANAEVAGDPAQGERFRRIAQLVELRVGLVEDSLRAYDKDGPEAALRIVKSDLGKRYTDEARALAALMIDTERKRLTERLVAQRAARGWAAAVSVAVVGTLLLAIAGVVRLLRHQLDVRDAVEDELAESRDRLDRLVESSPGMMSYWDAQLRNVYANPAYASWFGMMPSEMRGKRLVDVASPAVYEASRPYIEGVVAGRSQAFERTSVGPDGRNRYVEVRYLPDVNEGVVAGFFVFAVDVTWRKGVENALAASARRFRRLYEATPAMLLSVDSEGRVHAASDAWLDHMGYRRDDVVGAPWNVWVAHASRALADDTILPALFRTGRCRDVPLQLLKSDGTVVDALLSATVEGDSEPAQRRALALIEDVSARYRAEERARNSERLLGLAGAPASVGAWELDLPSGRMSWSDETCRIHGVEPGFNPTLEDAIGAFAPESRLTVERALQKAIATGKPVQLELPLVTRAGRRIWVRAVGEVQYAEGVPARIHGAIQDVTERRRNDDRIAAALAEKQSLLREVYHRVKNNLQVIRSLFELQIRTLSEASARDALRTASERVSALAQVLERAYQVEDFAAIRLAPYARDLCRAIGASTDTAGRAIGLELDLSDVAVGLDRAVPVGLVLNELVTNSVRHAFPAGRSGTIVVRVTRPEGDLVVLDVTDDGIGLPAEFELERGAGLGLRLCRLLARQIGGELLVRTERNGTCATLSFRTDLPHLDPLAAPPREVAREGSTPASPVAVDTSAR